MNIFILALEPLESRYTWDWFDFLPDQIRQFKHDQEIEAIVYNITGEQRESKVTDGAFLNFIDTNIWKNTQINQIAEYFKDGIVKPGDKFLFTDAWHPGLIQIRYMSSLTGIPVEIHSIWHAGSYDENDFLGRNFDKKWSYNFERSLYEASDVNYFATEYHLELFNRILEIKGDKSMVCGLPFDYLKDKIQKSPFPKEDIILFPHRISEEKQPEIFADLAKELPEYQFIFCQEKSLTKDEYYKLLQRGYHYLFLVAYVFEMHH
jgi:glycosyltransferase involved in cell wall biosynthesis